MILRCPSLFLSISARRLLIFVRNHAYSVFGSPVGQRRTPSVWAALLISFWRSGWVVLVELGGAESDVVVLFAAMERSRGRSFVGDYDGVVVAF